MTATVYGGLKVIHFPQRVIDENKVLMLVKEEDMDMALCDRCGEGVAEWQESQAEAASEWQIVRKVLDELADGCTACWVMQDRELAYLYD